MKVLFLFPFLFWINLTLGQESDSITITLVPVFNGERISLAEETSKPKNDTTQITALKFYLSNFQFIANEPPKGLSPSNYHLINLEESQSLVINLPTTKNQSYDTLTFNVGIDSLTHVSGAMGGDLDPINGMYWTWQSGYINFKLEGTSPVCQSRENEFIYHIGGYQTPFQTIQKIALPIDSANSINVEVELARLLIPEVLSGTNHIMSPGAQAVAFAKRFENLFTIVK
ncbi:MAG: MbnP family protein [Bacteroidota bacterium]